MKPWTLMKLLEATPEAVEASRVDCGTCPVSMQCIAGDGGNGWKFDCCGAAAVEVITDEGRVLLVMDCAENRFERNVRAEEFKECGLCNCDVVMTHFLGMSDHHRYVPTVHAKVPVRERLHLMHEAIPDAVRLRDLIAKRRRKE